MKDEKEITTAAETEMKQAEKQLTKNVKEVEKESEKTATIQPAICCAAEEQQEMGKVSKGVMQETGKGASEEATDGSIAGIASANTNDLETTMSSGGNRSDQSTDAVSDIQEMTQRDGNVMERLAPGAYSAAPGQDPRRMAQSVLTSLPSDELPSAAFRCRQDHTPASTAGNTSGGTFDLGLAQARPVAEDDLSGLEAARPVEPKTNTSRLASKRHYLLLATLLLVVIGGIAVLIGVLANQGGNDGDGDIWFPSNITNQTNVPTRKQYLEQMLPEQSIKTVLADVDSSQAMAFQWLLEDPSLYSYTSQRLMQRFALATLYYATKGPFWTANKNWLSYDYHECEWYAGTIFFIFEAPQSADSPCDNNQQNDTDDVYRRLWLPRNNLNGTIPDEIYYLSTLESIDLLMNFELTGPLSPNISLLTNLQKISVVRTSLTGTFPSELGLMSQMDLLYVGDSNFVGQVPTEIGLLKNMTQIAFGGNTHLSGTVPSEYGSLDKLIMLGFTNSKVGGTLPTELGLLTSLKYAYWFQNELSGTIPRELGLLNNLKYLHLDGNSLRGAIPSELGQPDRLLTELLLADNALSGSIPSETGLLSQLQILYLSDNPELTGTLPPEVNNLRTFFLEYFDISNTSVATESVHDDLFVMQQNLSHALFSTKCNRLVPCSRASDQANQIHGVD